MWKYSFKTTRDLFLVEFLENSLQFIDAHAFFVFTAPQILKNLSENR